ncbi:hypothetical protein MCAP1_000279 [Malassezia caprae]|uniref:Bud22 domain-containing protein n=1 Tax=Malassezia caprae TaxID=1381934 RepID=A0AAF0IUU8_9BASI|nr:hypothetical protein MCAP1_000279 [Malassezia caprae]
MSEAPTLDEAKIRAKLFELQKHVRRLKKASPQDARALEQELAYLKQIQPQVLAVRALYTKLVKSKLSPKPAARAQPADKFPLVALAQEHGLDAASVDALPKPEAGLEERVLHQLLSSKMLAEEIQTCIQALMALVHPAPAPDTKTPATEAPVREKDTKPKPKAREQPPAPEDEYESDDGMGNIGVRVNDAHDLDAMVASGSESEMEESEDALSDDDMPPRKRSRAPPDASTFLPSLNSGFIPATDGDDWSDAEADYADTGAIKGPAKSTRKNRRGQRERRAYVFHTDRSIWEKKYGRHANHLKLREKEPRVKARPSKVSPRTSDQRSTPSTRPKEPAPAAAPAPGTDSTFVHPSWAAKQKAKITLAQAKPQGTKIVFD